MSHPLDYQGTIVLKDNHGLQEVYSSQNYGTFYSLYMSFESSVDSADPDKITLTNVKFTLVNYKGIINLGIVDVEDEEKGDDGLLEFKVRVRAMERRREFHLRENGESKAITIDKKEIGTVKISRELQRMTEFDAELGPDHPDNPVFDEEFYYRDGLLFSPTENARIPRGGMDGSGEASSGKRCYKVMLKII